MSILILESLHNYDKLVHRYRNVYADDVVAHVTVTK